MMSPEDMNAIIAAQMAYAARRRANQNFKWDDEPELRSAWLKQLFKSFQYHEKLLEIHYAWMNYIKEAMVRCRLKDIDPVNYDFFFEEGHT